MSRYCGHHNDEYCNIVSERNVIHLNNFVDWYKWINPGAWDEIPEILYEIERRSIERNDNCFIFNGKDRQTPYIRGQRVQEILWPMAYGDSRNEGIKLAMVCGKPGCVNPFQMTENDLLYRIEQKVTLVQRPNIVGPFVVWKGNFAPKKSVPKERWYPRIRVD